MTKIAVSLYVKDDKGGLQLDFTYMPSRGEMKRIAKKFRKKNGPAGRVSVHLCYGSDGYAQTPKVVLL
jgi:hypothetical protein